jgi:hypothetical protein
MATVSTGTLSVTYNKTQTETLNIMTYLYKGWTPGTPAPLLAHLVGAGEIGTNPALLTVEGPFSDAAIAAGTDFPWQMNIVTIQYQNQNPQPSEIQGIVNALKAKFGYSALIGTAISRGGQCWDWFISNAESQMQEMAALAVCSSQGAGGEPGIPGGWQPQWLADNNIPYWAGCGDQDSFYATYTRINNEEVVTGGILFEQNELAAIATQLSTMDVFKGAGHSSAAWGPFFSSNYVSPNKKTNIYAWAATFGAVVAAPPVVAPPAGLSLPVATTAQLATLMPTAGLTYYNSTTGKITVGNGTAWT